MSDSAGNESGMSMGGWLKALALGLLGVLAVTGLTYFNDHILRGSFLVGNNMPFSVYGSLIIFVLTVNVVLYMIGAKLALNGQQLAVAMGLTLAVCCIPGSGLMRTFPTSIIMPHQHEKTQPGWKEEGIIDVAPKRMLVDVVTEEDVKAAREAGDMDLQANEKEVLDEYIQGWHVKYGPTNPAPSLAEDFIDILKGRQLVRRALSSDAPAQDSPVADSGVAPASGDSAAVAAAGDSGALYKSLPVAAWTPALTFWVPLILLLWLSLLGLALVVHRQWSSHELLPYPIVEFTDNLLPDSTGRMSPVFRSRLFWLGATVVLAIYMNNYIVTVAKIDWFLFPLKQNIKPLYDLTGLKSQWALQEIRVFFTVVAFSFMLSKEVSFSVGISVFLYTLLGTVLAAQFGITMAGGSAYQANIQGFLVFGSYLGMFGMIVYTGRHYYLRVVKRSLLLPTTEPVEGHAVLGMRVFILGFLLSCVVIRSVGLDWQLAVLYVAGIVLMFFIMSRIIAETGLFFIQVYWLPCGIIVGLFGAKALGPEAMIILFILSMVLAVDPREAFMPFIVNVLKLNDKRKVRLVPMSGWITAALIIGMAVALMVILTTQYRIGAPMHDGWATKNVPMGPFAEVLGYQQRLKSQGVLEASQSISGFARFAAFKPQEASFLWAMLAGVVLVVGAAWGRLRWSGWPLHPVAFLIWAAMPAQVFAWSFLIGWLLKVLVMKYGGAAVYQKIKPLMFGLIAGEMVGLVIPTVYSMIYYAATGGKLLESFRVMPG